MTWLLIPASLIFLIGSIFLYYLGGQTMVWLRRYLLPPLQVMIILGISFLLSVSWFVGLPQLLYMGVWSIGDGDNSALYKWLKSDTLVRIVYGGLATIPLIAGIALRHTHWWELAAIPLTVLAFLPNFGSWGKIGKYDILGSDVVRSAVLAIEWLTVVIVK